MLLATYNGQLFLEEQLQSLGAQDLPTINVIASDDGSSDATPSILEEWQGRWSKGDFTITSGPRQGFAANFRSLMRTTGHEADFYAFCDQDDVWDADKLSAAIDLLDTSPAGLPALYFSRTRLVEVGLREIGKSPLFRRAPSFRNAIVQSIGGGNTMVLNRAAFLLVQESCRRTGFVTHDWWSYLICSGAGGAVFYDNVPRIAYRQHGANQVGQNSTVAARLERAVQLFAGRFSQWNDMNLDGLDKCRDLLAPAAQETVDRFKSIRRVRGLTAWRELDRSGIFRQSHIDDLALRFAAAFGRL